MVHMYTVTNTTIFLVVRLLLLRYNYMFRPSILAIFRLYMRNLSISYTNMCGEFTVLWGGVGARSRFVLDKGRCGLGLFWGVVLFLLFDNTTGMTHLKISSPALYAAFPKLVYRTETCALYREPSEQLPYCSHG